MGILFVFLAVVATGGLMWLMLQIHDKYTTKTSVLHVDHMVEESMGMDVCGGKYKMKYPELWEAEVECDEFSLFSDE